MVRLLHVLFIIPVLASAGCRMDETDARQLLLTKKTVPGVACDWDGKTFIVPSNTGASYEDPERELGGAALRRKLEAFALLRQSGAMTINSTDTHGETALSKAIRLNDLKEVEALLALGADPNCEVAREPCLVRAVENRNLDMLKILVAHGAEAYDEGDAYRQTAFCAACRMTDSRDMVEFLIEHGACLECPADDSAPPLLIATLENKKILLDHGANINAFDPAHGGNALDFAIYEYVQAGEEGRPRLLETIRFLLEKGIDVNSGKVNGQTNMMTAAKTGDPDLVGLVLRYGGKPWRKEPGGKTAFDCVPEDCQARDEILSMMHQYAGK